MLTAENGMLKNKVELYEESGPPKAGHSIGSSSPIVRKKQMDVTTKTVRLSLSKLL